MHKQILLRVKKNQHKKYKFNYALSTLTAQKQSTKVHYLEVGYGWVGIFKIIQAETISCHCRERAMNTLLQAESHRKRLFLRIYFEANFHSSE